jgi:D-glycero-alpha-D-manno-heptose-7-phosphate kinase
MRQRMPFGDEIIEASAPCRIDMGGTLDLSTFFLPLRHFDPCTFNIALDMRTRVRLWAFDAGKIKVSSRGFDDLAVEAEAAPFNHPLGLMLAVARYFGADGVHIDIHSASPPRSALGGSSVAAVALIWAFSKALHKSGHGMPERGAVALLAHAIEQSVAGVPCGMQDQLAAVFGGVHVWHWKSDPGQVPYTRQPIPYGEEAHRPSMNRCLLVAYCGVPHVSKDINGTWVRQFVAGWTRWGHDWRRRRGIGNVAPGSRVPAAADACGPLGSRITSTVCGRPGKRCWTSTRMRNYWMRESIPSASCDCFRPTRML